jgi:uncharacterized protein (DUF58 family)
MLPFDSSFLKKLEYLSLVSRRTFRGQLLAHRRTKQMGSGIEFADHRDYAPGDDLRYLDWNLYARHGDLLLKRFHEEEDLHVYLFVDCSRSMQFGQPTKFDYARQIAAALAYIALADLDRVGVVAFAGTVIDAFPLTRGKEQILSLLQFLERLNPAGAETDLARVASQFVHQGSRTGLIIVISDLFDPAGFARGLDMLRHHRFEPNLVQVYDRHEQSPPLRGDAELRDVETSNGRMVTVSPRSLRNYRRAFDQFLESVRRYSRSYGLACAQTTTDMPFDELVLHMMRSAGVVG